MSHVIPRKSTWRPGGGHAEAVVAMGAAGTPADDDVVAVGGRVLEFDVDVGKGVKEPARAALNSAGP